jgi:CDP-glycerol glycerophosphotransferase
MSTISVIVPIYNVEPYLEDCLSSIAGQTHRDLQVICVNDGSTDDSAAIAERFAATDPRFEVVHQPNAGLGAARNTGIRLATGDYLSFVDSDDYLPPDALELLYRSLQVTGSDFATGNVKRATPLGVKQSPMHRQIFRDDRPATHVTRDEILLFDRLACNKLFRRAFWMASGRWFPEGVFYEDTPVILPLHFLARSVDVVSAPVYVWRERITREDRSITQRRLEIKNMRDRVRAVTTVSEFLREDRWADSKREYDRLAITSELRIFTRLLDEADPEYQREFVDLASRFLRQAHPEALASVTAVERLKWHLIEREMLEELLTVVGFEKRFPHGAAAVKRLGRVYATLPFYGDRGRRIPRRVFRYDNELDLVTRVTGVEVGERAIEVSGWAYIKHLACPDAPSLKLRVWLRDTRTGARIEGSVRREDTPQATVEARPNLYDYAGSGFRVRFPVAALLEHRRSGTARWEVLVRVRSGRTVREGTLARPMTGAARRPPFRDVGRTRISPRYESDGGLAVVVRGRPATVSAVEAREDELRLLVRTRRPLARLELRGANETVIGDVLPVDGPDGEAVARIDAVGLLEGTFPDRGAWERIPKRVWTVHAVYTDGRESRLLATADLEQRSVTVDGAELSLDVTRYGNVSVSLRPPPTVWVDEVAEQPTGFELVGTLVGGDGRGLTANLSRTDRREYRPLEVRTSEGGGIRVALPFRVQSLAGDIPLPSGRWTITVSRVTGEGPPQPIEVRPRAPLIRQLPVTAVHEGKEFELEDVSWEQLALRVWTDTSVRERGEFHQQQLARAARQRPRRATSTVLFDSYTGRQYSDSPRAVLEELQRRDLDLDLAWVVRDRQVSLPDGVRPVPLFRRPWHDALVDATAIVTNAHLPNHYRRSPGQVCIQTWHGTPLKRIGLDIADIRWGSTGYKERIATESQQWTHLISPNSFSSPILRRAFGYEGQLLEIGYPRNDVLLAPDLASRREADARRFLGLPEGRGPVLLFTPTWRDDEFHAVGRFRLDLRIELDRLRAAAGPDAVLLVRRHPNVVDAVDVRQVGPGIVDVSEYPDLADLYLVSDALITDYSSSMFDYALTGKPILFYVYDLDHYRDQLRGFYFDFESRAPGPLLRTEDELYDAVGDLSSLMTAYTDPYARFVRDFGDLDDGHASARAVDALLAGLAEQ